MSIWDVSLAVANRWYSISWWGLLLSGAATAVATIFTVIFLFIQFWTSTVRDEYADKERLQLKAATAAAERDLVNANERISVNESAAAAANERAANAELALARYRAGRTLTPQQSGSLVESLKQSPKGRVIIKPNFQDTEATSFANELSRAFNEAGFSGVGDSPLEILSYNRPGLFLAVRDTSRPPPATEPILRAFTDAGIPIESGFGDWVPDFETIVIVVARNP
jgi:hypothetical protein